MEGQVSLPMDFGNLHKDEDLSTIQKRKSRHKFSLLHPIPIKVLNSIEDSNGMKKRKETVLQCMTILHVNNVNLRKDL